MRLFGKSRIVRAVPNPPTCSIIVASGAGGEFLFRCLDSLSAQDGLDVSEILVVDRVGGELAERVRRDYPHVKLLDHAGAEKLSVPQLRLAGAREARGSILCVLEEHCVAPPGWLRTAIDRFEAAPSDVLAIGGPILDDDFDRIRDWVVYFSEYHNFLPPWADGERYLLNGANIAYRRAAVLEHESELTEGYWEVVLHPRLAERGKLVACNAMGAKHTGPFDFGYYLEQRYLLSRVWGGSQRDRVGAGKRIFYLLFAPVFPFLLLARIAARVLKSPQYLPRFVLALPLLLPVVFAYVFGEWRGYLSGVGDALERVE